MSWLAYALIGMTIWSATAVADRALLLRITSIRFYLLVPTLLQLLLCIALLPFMPALAGDTSSIAIAILSGVMEAGVIYFLYVAMSKEEVSRVFSLSGLGPILTLIFGTVFLGEVLAREQLIAFALFFLGGLILSVQLGTGWKAHSLSKALGPIFVGSLISSLFFILLRHAFVSSDFWTGFFYSRIGFFIAGIFLLFVWRKEIVREWRRLSSNVRTAVIGNQVVAFSGHCFYFLSLSLGSAALVQAALSVQGGIIFVMALLVAGFDRRLLEERLTRRDVIQKAIGITLAASAAYILAVS